jgi:hypothetical protein
MADITGVNPRAGIAPLATDSSPHVIALPGGGYISTPFVYQSVKIQNAANSVYVNKSTIDAQYAATNPASPKKYIFRTDYERMQYIIGKRGVAPGASGY